MTANSLYMRKLRNGLILAGVGFFIVSSWISRLPVVLAQEPERVGLVVQFDDETIQTSCIDTHGQALTGQDILQLSGLELDLYYDANQEIAVCKVNQRGCDASHCFCQFPDYWSYWHLEADQWIYSGRGSSTYLVQPGSVEGWRWGDGSSPPQISYEQICPPLDSGATPAASKDQPITQTGEAADISPTAEVISAPVAQPETSLASLGYLVFGLALVAMGSGLVYILK